MTELLRIENMCRDYPMGQGVVRALRGVSLTVEEGEFLAVIGPSGSGKSTLMYALGCLDRPTSGTYRLRGREVSSLSDAELSRIRNREIGYVFQEYNLLGEIDVVDNVALGLVYAGAERSQRRQVGAELAGRLGLGERLEHRPTELSGGQMQRVAIARALAAQPGLILADEPTGNLDSKTGAEILGLLEALNRAGHTIIMVTHDSKVANRAHRVISIADGVIVSDEQVSERSTDTVPELPIAAVHDGDGRADGKGAGGVRTRDLARMAFREGIRAHKLRSALTMLGIVFGIAAVISMTAITEGGKRRQLDQIRQIGMNNIQVRDLGLDGIRLLRVRRVNPYGVTSDDLDAILAHVPGVAHVTAWKEVKAELRNGLTVVDDARVLGISGDYQEVSDFHVGKGRFLDADDETAYRRVCVLGRDVAAKLKLGDEPLDKIVILGDEPFLVVGVMQYSEFSKSEITDINIVDRNMDVYVPYGALRMFFRKDERASRLDSVSLRMETDEFLVEQSKAIHRIVSDVHRQAEDFAVSVPLEKLRQAQQTKEVFNVIITVIAAISLMVGGIGIMNIMLANVTERTREIGIRRAVGAARRDVLRQFLAEAVLISFVGGILGVCVGILAGLAVQGIFGFWVTFKVPIMALSVLVAMTVGIGFGIYPAWMAARMDPVEALRA